MDARIEAVLAGTTPEAQEALINLLVEAINVWVNLHIAGDCDAHCKRHADISSLRRLHDALVDARRAGGRQPMAPS